MKEQEPTKPVHAHKLAQLCWTAIMSIEPTADDKLIREAIDYAHGHTDSEPTPESMRKIAEYIWLEGFTACLRGQELGAFSRVENN